MFDWHNIFFRGHSKLAPNNGRAQSNALLGILMRSWAANEVNQYEIPNATTSSIFRQRSLWCHRGRRFVSRYQEAGWMEREREREKGVRACAGIHGSRGPPFIRAIYEGEVYRPIQKQFSVKLGVENSTVVSPRWLSTRNVDHPY